MLFRDKLDFKLLDKLAAVFKINNDWESQNGHAMEGRQMGHGYEKGKPHFQVYINFCKKPNLI